MERRFTGFLIPILIATLVYLLFFSDGPEKQQDEQVPTQDPSLKDPVVQQAIDAQPQNEFVTDGTIVRHTFGSLPAAGGDGQGFQVTWSRYGAGVRNILMNDHFVTPKSSRKEVKEPKDYYAVVPSYPPFRGVRSWKYGLVLEEWGRNRFKRAIDDGPKNQLWEVAPFREGDNEIRFTLDLGEGLVLSKTFRYVPTPDGEPKSRDLEVEIGLTCNGDRVNAPSVYDLRLRGVHVWNPSREKVFQNPAAAVAATIDGVGDPTPVQVLASGAQNQTLLTTGPAAKFSYAGTTSRFFGGLLYPADDKTADAVKAVQSSVWPPVDMVIPDVELDGKPDQYEIPANTVPEVYCQFALNVPEKGKTESLTFKLYLGPKSSPIFKGTPEYERLMPVMDGALDPSCCCTVPGVVPLAKVISWLLRGFHSVVGNWGVAIIMLTLLVRILLSPLNFNMQRTMRAHGAKMADLKPKMDKMQAQYKDDPKRLQMEMMKFQKEHKLITAPLKGCLPILVTMPIWFGLFTALRVMYELRHQPFALWIDDLSRPDQLFPTGIDWSPVAHFNLLPFLMVGLWLYLQMGTPLPKDPQQRQMMVMMRFMPVMMGVMLYTYASGLMIYMCTSSVWGIVEQKVTKRILGPVNPDSGMSMPTMV